MMPPPPPPPPRLSVALSVYNGERFLAAAIDSVLQQSFGDFEFLILDDGSTDASTAIITAYATSDRRIRPICRDNRGLVASLNQLLAAARAPLVARMDADDLCHPDRFARQIAFLDAHPEIGVLGTWTDNIDELGAPWPVASADHPLDHAAFCAAVTAGTPLLCHPSVMYRRDLVLRIGGYHPAYRHCEDLDLWLRLADHTHIANLPERLLRYRHYAAQVSSRHATEQQVNAAIARLAWAERRAGRTDPTATLDHLPPLDHLDTLFNQTGLAAAVRARVAPGLLHARPALAGEGFDLLCAWLREDRNAVACPGLWRTVVRLVRFGLPWRAVRLAGALLSARVRGG